MIESLVIWIHGQRELVRVSIVAAFGTVLAWWTYEIVFFLNPLEPRATVSWVIAFTIGVFRQHHLHRTLTFPATKLSYGDSLWRDGAASVVILAASAGLNFVLNERLGLHHRVAWLICLTSVAGFEYMLMKLFVFRLEWRGLNRK
jgi:putative flippase GtrA